MKVSVIIPTEGKRKELLQHAVKSYYLQNVKLDSEILVETGGSLSQNINSGIIRAKGKWIKILADDDLLVLGTLSSMVDFAENGDYDWIYADACNFTDLDEMPEGWEPYYQSSYNGFKAFLARNTIHGGTTLYKKSILMDIGGYDENLDTAEEYDLHLKLLVSGYKHGYFNEIVYLYRLHENNKSNSMGGKLKQERKEWIRKYIISRYV